MTVIDPAKGEKPVYFFEQDFDKQQMACELMDLREEVAALKKKLKLANEIKEYWEEQAAEQFRTRQEIKRNLINKISYDVLAEEY